MPETNDIKVWLDLDGVVADFASAIQSRLGFHPESHIAEDPTFWGSLDALPGSQDLWGYISSYDTAILTGVGSDPDASRAGKKDWVLRHFGCEKTSVIPSGRKSELCRPGDILIDDSEANIASWTAAGGIGILHKDVPSTLNTLRSLGVLGDGQFSPEFMALVDEKRANKTFKREGYTGYVLTPSSQSALVKAFGVENGVSGLPYRLVCQHITRCFPARNDTVSETHPKVEVVGEFFNQATGHHVLAVTIDGEIHRPNGGYYHITYGLDDSAESQSERNKNGQKRPTAAGSNDILVKAVEAAGGDESVLFNLPVEKRLSISADFALLDQKKLEALPKVKPPIVESKTVTPYVYENGISDGNGGILTSGQRVILSKGHIDTISYEIFGASGTSMKHSDGDKPAIQRVNTLTGEVIFEAWASEGKISNQPLALTLDAHSTSSAIYT